MDELSAAAIAVPGIQARVLERCGSTNHELLKDRRADVLLAAEEQTAGRGRRGRRWRSARGAGVTFSLSRILRRPLRELPGLSLVAGVAAVRALRELGVTQAALKWPNDLVVDGAKLGGILVETCAAPGGVLAVIGVGINCRRDAALERSLRRRIASLDQLTGPPARATVIREVTLSLIQALDDFEARGLAPLAREWERLDAHAGQRMRVRLADGRVLTGVARGLAEDGGLRLQTRAGLRAVRSGRVLSAR
jgi:BirA family transcriptional regulator, biotin operon repressor / biotin---[acetyl-CoA-carboxylase] ligase